MILGLALIPSKSFQKRWILTVKTINRISIKPHVTIKAQFEIEDGDLDSVIDRLVL